MTSRLEIYGDVVIAATGLVLSTLEFSARGLVLFLIFAAWFSYSVGNLIIYKTVHITERKVKQNGSKGRKRKHCHTNRW